MVNAECINGPQAKNVWWVDYSATNGASASFSLFKVETIMGEGTEWMWEAEDTWQKEVPWTCQRCYTHELAATVIVPKICTRLGSSMFNLGWQRIPLGVTTLWGTTGNQSSLGSDFIFFSAVAAEK